ncbi:hypothetical protein ABPG74_011426 [Tetrahymena malaccensis]
MDQIVQEISIQFPTIPEILALVNSTYALLLTLGFIFRALAQKEIIKDFFYIFLQNMYQETYQEVLKQNKLFEQTIQSQQTHLQVDQQQDGVILIEKEPSDNSQLPQFPSKFMGFLKQNTLKQINSSYSINQKDEIKETSEYNFNNESQISYMDNSPQKFSFIQNKLRLKNESINNYSNLKQAQLNLSSIKTSEVQKPRGILEGINLSQINTNSIKFKEISIEQKNKIKIENNPEDISIKLRNIKDKQIFNKAKNIIFEKRKTKLYQQVKYLWKKMGFCLKRKEIDKDEINQFQISKRAIEKQINEQLNILDFIKDLLFIKKSIMILLSKEQLAALQLVGYSSSYLRQESNKCLNQKQKEQQNILDSCDLQCKYIKKFFQKSQNDNYNEKDINQRILSVINYNQQSKQ